jgi:hypothetical protein
LLKKCKLSERGISDFALIWHEVQLSNKTAVFFTVSIMTIIEENKSKTSRFVGKHPIQIRVFSF